MKIKGFTEWRNHLPGLKGKKIAVIPILAFVSLLGTWTFYFSLNHLSRWFPTSFFIEVEPILPLLGSLIGAICAFSLVYSFFSRKEALLKKDKATAYEHGVKFGFVGIVIILATILYIYEPIIWFPLHLISIPTPINPLTSILSSSVFDLLFNRISSSENPFQVIFGLIFCVLGLLLIHQSVKLFGFDYVTAVYLYYPEESHLVDYKIYSIVRNPVYLGALIVGFGGVLFRCSLYAAILFGVVCVFFLVHIHFVEDKELVDRFGTSFLEYTKKVPALFVSPKNWKQLLLFIFGKWD
ncbi:MAG: methyltransferase family protein [Candidatus Hermodarchaeota archaeon]